MPGWVISALLAVAVGVLIYVFGSQEALTILVLMGAWFVALGLVLLGIEMLIQLLASKLRRTAR